MACRLRVQDSAQLCDCVHQTTVQGIPHCAFAGLRPPAAGELLISEIMYNPEGVRDDLGEWVEIYNPQGDSLDLDGCTIGDRAFTSDIENVVIPGGQYAGGDLRPGGRRA